MIGQYWLHIIVVGFGRWLDPFQAFFKAFKGRLDTCERRVSPLVDTEKRIQATLYIVTVEGVFIRYLRQ